MALQREQQILLSINRTLRIHSGIKKSVSEKSRTLRGDQPTVDFDTAANCCLYVTQMKAMDFKDEIPPINIEYRNDHYVLLFNLTTLQYDTGTSPYPELVG